MSQSDITVHLKRQISHSTDCQFHAGCQVTVDFQDARLQSIGVALRAALNSTKGVLTDFSDAITRRVCRIIRFLHPSVTGLVFNSISTSGIEALTKYATLILLPVGTMVFIALIVNPLIVFIAIYRNSPDSIPARD